MINEIMAQIRQEEQNINTYNIFITANPGSLSYKLQRKEHEIKLHKLTKKLERLANGKA